MDINLEQETLVAYKKAGGDNRALLDAIKEGKTQHWYSHDIKTDYLTIPDIEKLITIAEADPNMTTDADARRHARELRAILTMKQAGKTGGAKTVNLKLMADMLKEYLADLPHHWVFTKEQNLGEQLVPWFIENIRYHPPERRNDYTKPAHTNISLKAKRRGAEEEKTISIYREELRGGVDALSLLEQLNVQPETPELYDRYLEELETYEDYVSMTGEQFLAGGKAWTGYKDEQNERDYWSREKIFNLERDGSPSRAIMDDSVQFGKDGKGAEQTVYAYPLFWLRGKDEDDVEQQEENTAPPLAPVQPYLCIFTLLTHQFVVTHVSNLAPYVYDKTLFEKLVLPDDQRHLIDVLIKTKHRDSEDLVLGKKGGVVVLCSGAPGTGKTLTAEVYAEFAERPLYNVQCSQLGIKAKQLEENLGIVLRRAVRWNAIILLDEADVYIHERSKNTKQNAIVGVFLRLLEYFSGVLFMTTNRAVVVDDAVHSRCIAHIRYEMPGELARRKIWKILAKQYGVELTKEMRDELVTTFPSISGRSIKQLCRLVQTMGEPPTIKLFKWLATFQDGIETTKESDG